MFPQRCLMDDRQQTYRHYKTAKRWNGVMQAGVIAAVASWMIIPVLRLSAWHSPAMYGLLPALTLGLIIDAYVEVKQYQAVAILKHKTMSRASKLRVLFAITAAITASVTVSAWLLALASGVVVIGLPYFVVAIGALRLLYQLSNVVVSYQHYQRCEHSYDRAAGRQSMAAEGIKLGITCLIVGALVGLLVVPFPSALLIGLVALSAVASAGWAAWHSAPATWRRPMKQRYELFKNNRDSPNVLPSDFGLEPGT